MSFLILTRAETSLACFTPPPLKWWPSLLPLPSAMVPSEVRIIDSLLLLPWSHITIDDLPHHRTNSVSTTSVFTVNPFSFVLLVSLHICGHTYGMPFIVRVCFIEDEN